MADNKMMLWDRVMKTNPKYTKPVKFGRGFTAIDPHSQIMCATQEFGPVGSGWGWKVVRVEYLPTNEVGMLIRLWHGSKDQHYEQWGQASLYIDKDNTKTDGDCMKKATTDGLTKCLSYLGFNADIFLGKFDDSKYVQAMAEEFASKPSDDLDHDTRDQLNNLVDRLDRVEALADLEAMRDECASMLEALAPNPGDRQLLKAAMLMAKTNVTKEAA